MVMRSSKHFNHETIQADRSINSSQSPSTLPIDDNKESLLYLLEKNDVLIVVGETGSGKSTRIPQILHSTGIYNPNLEQGSSLPGCSNSNRSHRQIGVTQPRRVAAVQLANRVAQDLGCNVGQTVGYAVRFRDVSNPETKIKFLTEGLLIREIMIDPLLNRYSVIMVDEVHERNIHCDILLGLLRCLLKKRTDFKLIICSATIDIHQIKRFFSYSNDCTKSTKRVELLVVEGRRYPIKTYHLTKAVPNYVDATIDTIISIHESRRLASGKILAFLTGQDEVESACERLADYVQSSSSRLDLKKLVVLPLHASLKAEAIERVFKEADRNSRICIISTSVAETSLTIDGIAFVVDCGFTKLRQFNHLTGIDSLVRVPISKGSAKQRAGRAGRTREGVVYRLYTKHDFDNLPEVTTPDIQRTSMVEPVMLLMSIGIENPHTFPLLTPMPKANLISALELLHSLGAIDHKGHLTPDGQIMSQFNLDPRIAKILIESPRFGCSKDICKISAMLQVNDIYVRNGKSSISLFSNEFLAKTCVSEGDMISYLNILNGFLAVDKSKRWADKRNLNYQALLNASEIAFKLESQLKRFNIKLSSSKSIEPIQKCMLSGLFANAAYLHPNGDYKTIKGDQLVHIHPTSVYNDMTERPNYVLFCEILFTKKPYMRHLMSVEHEWLLNSAKHYYTFATELEMIRSRV